MLELIKTIYLWFLVIGIIGGIAAILLRSMGNTDEDATGIRAWCTNRSLWKYAPLSHAVLFSWLGVFFLLLGGVWLMWPFIGMLFVLTGLADLHCQFTYVRRYRFLNPESHS